MFTTQGHLFILEGNVGAGKTTTLNKLRELKPEFVYYEENYAKDCPHLNELYKAKKRKDIKRLTLLSQLWILERCIITLNKAVEDAIRGCVVVMDRSIFGMIPFVAIAVKDELLSEIWNDLIFEEMTKMKTLLNYVPYTVCYLWASSDILVKRVESRDGYIPVPDDRDGLISDSVNLTKKKIDRLSIMYDSTMRNFVSNYPKRKITIDTSNEGPEDVCRIILDEYKFIYTINNC